MRQAVSKSLSKKSVSNYKMKKNILLFPGNFSPLNIAHLMMALSAYNILKAECCYFLPYQNVEDNTSIEDRIEMIRLGIHDYGIENEHFKVSNYFQNHEKFVDMVSYFKRKFPLDRLIILLGEDELNSFYAREGIDKITYLSQVYYVPRDDSFSHELEKRYIIKPLSMYKMGINSSEIRKGHQLYTTKSVLNYIGLKRLYFCQELASMMKEKRYLHSLSVAKTAYEIVKHNLSRCDISPEVAFQAGIFHDCGKDLPVKEQKEIVNKYYSSYTPCPDFALHEFVGNYLAKNKFGINNEDVLSSIMFHCTGKGNMTKLEKIVYAADKVEPKREFETRRCRLACYNDFEKGFVLTLLDQKRYFEEKHISFMEHKLSKEMYHQYCEEIENA